MQQQQQLLTAKEAVTTAVQWKTTTGSITRRLTGWFLYLLPREIQHANHEHEGLNVE